MAFDHVRLSEFCRSVLELELHHPFYFEYVVSADNSLHAAARTQRDLGRMEQIRFAVLEVNGKISVIPQEQLHE